MLPRRRFLQVLAAVSVSPALPACAHSARTIHARSRSPSASPRAIRIREAWCCGRGWWADSTRSHTRCAGRSRRMRRCGPSSLRAAPWPSRSGPTRCAWSRRARSPTAGTGTGSWRAMRRQPVARTRTAPRPGCRSGEAALRVCLLPAVRAGLSTAPTATSPPTQPDLVAFLGDYIYESSWGKDRVRSARGARAVHAWRTTATRYAALQVGPRPASRAMPPAPGSPPGTTTRWTTTTRTTVPRTACRREQFLLRRAAAYRAYYEHMPLPERMKPRGPDMRIYTQLGGPARALLRAR